MRQRILNVDHGWTLQMLHSTVEENDDKEWLSNQLGWHHQTKNPC